MKLLCFVLLSLIASPSFTLANTTPIASPVSKISTAEKDRIRKAIRGDVLVAGGWTGGGGEGGICFKSKAEKEAAFDAEGKLRKESIPSKTTLQTFDIAENNFGSLPLLPRAGDDVKSYLDYVVTENIAAASPYFALRVRQALALILNADGSLAWEDRGPLAKLNDGGPRRKSVNADTCAIVQLVARYQKVANGGLPQVFVDYDKDLYDHLGDEHPSVKIIHQAALILHEALYLSGVEIGMRDSSRTRQLNYWMMSRGLKAFLSQQGAARRSLMFTSLIYTLGFRNQMSLFVDPSVVASPFSKESRQKARAELATVYRDNAEGLLRAGKIPNNCNPNRDRACDETILRSLAQKLSPEQSFMFLAASYQNARKTRFDLDVFLVPGDDRAEASEVCRLITADQVADKGDDYWAGFYVTAQRYCEGWLKAK